MTSTNLQRKRSNHGASLILLVSIIGLAFIVTVGALLLAASNAQDTARLASAKVDVANREDVLMREILRETATGMLNTTPETWTTGVGIMKKATDNLLATSYVDLQELATLQSTGAIPAKVTTANTGDTGGNPLDIFQGYQGASGEYNREVPFGGTSGVSNDAFLDPNYRPTQRAVAPPHMNWSGNTTLSLADATTTPQEFFLGSQYTGLSAAVTKLSPSNRWGQITYPAIRFGYKKPGDQFVARRVWWRIPVVYQTAQQTVDDQKVPPVYRYPSAPANYVLSVYEIPSQLPISGNANFQIGADTSGTAWGSNISVTGSISGNQITLSGGNYSGVSSRQQVQVQVGNPVTVGGVPYSSDSTGSGFDQPGTREQMALTQTPGSAAPVSVAGNDGKVLLVPVMPGNDFYMSAPNDQPTKWDLYGRPFYKCVVRIIINSYDDPVNHLVYTPTGTASANISVTVLYRIGGTPDAILGVRTTDSGWTPVTYSQGTGARAGDLAFSSQTFMQYTSTHTGVSAEDRNILLIDISKLALPVAQGGLGLTAPQLYSVYIGANPTAAPSPDTDIGVAIIGGGNLSTFTNGLSIITKQRLYLIDAFNKQASPGGTSIYAPEVRYGISAINQQLNLTGQVAVVTSSNGVVNPLNFKSGNGTAIRSNVTTATLGEVTDPTLIPPITALNLLFTIEKERTN